jgi:hypothetical protein
MNTAFDILVFVLGSLLGIFLILSIVTIVLVLRLIAALRAIVAKGEHLVDNAEAIGETIRDHAGAVSVLRMLMHVAGNLNSSKRRKD